MKKYTQWDLVVIALATHDHWCNSYIFKGLRIPQGLIGSEADTRLYELFDKSVGDFAQTTTRVIDGNTYTIETKKEKGRRMYKAYLSQKKPIRQLIHLPPSKEYPMGLIREIYQTVCSHNHNKEMCRKCCPAVYESLGMTV